MAVFGGIGGGVTRDVLLNTAPGSLTNPWYLILVFLAWIAGLLLAFGKGQKFRETFYQFMTSFSLPWYAVVGVVGPIAGRFLIDVGCGNAPKHLVQGEWFIGTAVLTSISFFLLRAGAYGGPGPSLSLVAASLLAFLIGFVFAWPPPGSPGKSRCPECSVGC